MAIRDHFKFWKMGMPEDSQALQDLLEYGRELGMQPAETARVIIVEWSQARRGRMVLGGGVQPLVSTQPQTARPAPSSVVRSQAEHERAKAREGRTLCQLVRKDIARIPFQWEDLQIALLQRR
jgi:hypothetical protein